METVRHKQRTKNEERRTFPFHLPPSTFHPKHKTKNASHGFTLIEVTLATVVIGMGLLAVFGLGQLALRNAKATEDDTRAAMLAEDVFASLRTVSENLCASNNPAAWTAFWNGFQTGTPLTNALSTTTSFSNQYPSTIMGNGSMNYLSLFSWPQIHNASPPIQIPEWSARYWLAVVPSNNTYQVTLNIAPGASGSIGESRQFFTLFAEHGTLP